MVVYMIFRFLSSLYVFFDFLVISWFIHVPYSWVVSCSIVLFFCMCFEGILLFILLYSALQYGHSCFLLSDCVSISW